MSVRGLDELGVGQCETAGPVQVGQQQLAAFIAVTGEAHPLHLADQVVPAGLLQSMVAGALVREHGPWRVIGLRAMTWRFHRRVLAEVPFWVTSTITGIEPIDEERGLVSLRRDVTSADGALLARGQVQIAVRR